MLSLQKSKKPHLREFRGPEPGSVMVLCREPMKKPADWRIQERRKEEEAKADVMDQLKYQKKCDLRGQWEHNTSQKIQVNNVRRRTAEQKRLIEINLEQRRDRLRNLLESDERNCILEMNNTQETTLERQAKLRERARVLKEQKEAERQQLANEKFQQLWRSQSEGLRTNISKRTTEEIQHDRLQQIQQNKELDRIKEEENIFFRQLGANELQRKVDREERDAQAAEARNKEQMNILEQQMAAHIEKKAEEKRLMEEEMRLLVEMARLREIEERREAEERRRKEQGIRDMLQMSAKMKMRRKAKEIQEEAAFDSMILEQLTQEAEQEAQDDAMKQQTLQEEDVRYRQYLTKMKATEKARERELERLADIEIDKQWQARINQWDKEAQARKTLMLQVLEDRKRQIQDRMLENERQLALVAKERETIAKQIEDDRLKGIAEKASFHQRFMDHQNDLLSQIEFNRHLRQLEREADERETAKVMEEERMYQQRMAAVMQEDWVDPKAHPMRKALLLNAAKR